MRTPVLAALALTLAAAPGAARDRNVVPAAVPDGPPRSCVSLAQLRESQVRSDQVIDFRRPGGRDNYYRVTLPQPCPDLGFEKRFAYETSLTQLCSTDIITVLHDTPIYRGASCGMGVFQPVKLVRAPHP